MPQFDETIFALASASGRAGVAVLRISGPKASYVLKQMIGGLIEPRKATLRLLRDPVNLDPIDRALLLWFPAPSSFTGEDIVEIHCHGSKAVVAKLLSVLAGFADVRLADPGEFARRAFEHGKMDLTAIEGLADLINAETEGQRRQALRQSEGALGKLYESWREQILTASALVEAMIDFSDEEDVTQGVGAKVHLMVGALQVSITDHLESSGRRGEQMRDGFRIVIAGAPNVGKSSLLNSLANRDAAIVTSEPGTTRDVIEVHMTIGGFLVLVMDTAGIRETTGIVEQEGIKRTIDRLSDADLVLWLTDCPEMLEDTCLQNLSHCEPGPENVWRILSKADLREQSAEKRPNGIDLAISSKTNVGISTVITKIEDLLETQQDRQSSPLITRARHRT